MSVIDPARIPKSFQQKPTAWCCAKALTIVGVGAAAWAAAIIVLLKV